MQGTVQSLLEKDRDQVHVFVFSYQKLSACNLRKCLAEQVELVCAGLCVCVCVGVSSEVCVYLKEWICMTGISSSLV